MPRATMATMGSAAIWATTPPVAAGEVPGVERCSVCGPGVGVGADGHLVVQVDEGRPDTDGDHRSGSPGAVGVDGDDLVAGQVDGGRDDLRGDVLGHCPAPCLLSTFG